MATLEKKIESFEKKKSIFLSVWINRNQARRLSEAASALGFTRAVIIRTLIDRHLGTLFLDLSTNKGKRG